MIEAINEALELLHITQNNMGPDREWLPSEEQAHWDRVSKCMEGLEGLRQQEPVAHVDEVATSYEGDPIFSGTGSVKPGQLLYAAPAWQYIGEMREEGVVWLDRNPHAFPLGTRYYALSGDATDMVAEIERPRQQANEVQAARHVMREHNRLLVELAASQAREEQLRDALWDFRNAAKRISGMQAFIGEFENADEALALPHDTSALEAIVARAGEVMRERCLASAQDEMDEQYVDSSPWYAARACREAIRALPGATLEDLQK